MKHLRSIARSPSHITHESNHDLLARLRVKAPLDVLHDLWVTNVARWQERRHALTADDICMHIPPVSRSSICSVRHTEDEYTSGGSGYHFASSSDL